MSSRPSPASPIHPEASFTFRFSMTDTQQAPMGHTILPPMYFPDHPYSSTPVLPPPVNYYHQRPHHQSYPFTQPSRQHSREQCSTSNGRTEPYSQAEQSVRRESSPASSHFHFSTSSRPDDDQSPPRAASQYVPKLSSENPTD
jgi:hypothetical protein